MLKELGPSPTVTAFVGTAHGKDPVSKSEQNVPRIVACVPVDVTDQLSKSETEPSGSKATWAKLPIVAAVPGDRVQVPLKSNTPPIIDSGVMCIASPTPVPWLIVSE